MVVKMVLVIIIIVAALSGLSMSQIVGPKCLETPGIWSGYLYSTTISTQILSKITLASYDRTQEKLKLTDIKIAQDSPMIILLEDYNAMTRYMSTGGTCSKQTLEGAFPQLGVPENATFEGPVEYLGSDLPGLGVQVAHYTSYEGGFSYYTYHPLDALGVQCIPIMTSIATIEPLQETVVEYTNITTILPQDPFSIPPGCEES